MIIYKPTDNIAVDIPMKIRPKTAFIMTKIGDERSEFIKKVHSEVETILKGFGYGCIDASSKTTGKDYLQKIIDIIVSVPLGIIIIDDDLPSTTLSNIFYEMGWLDALGKETVIIKSLKTKIPSDLTRTEYIQYDSKFESKLSDFMVNLQETSEWYSSLANYTENNPLLAIDYLRRAYLISNESVHIKSARTLIADDEGNKRAKNSVENLLSFFMNTD